MDKKLRKVLLANYLKDFKCIGGACEDSCCTGWNVFIDKGTFQKYRKLRAGTVKELIDQHIVRNRSNPSVEQYAKLTFKGKTDCPMLTENKLCRIQLEYGEQYLSNICSAYPRQTNVVDGQLERMATLSCPEAARLALLNPAGIGFEIVEEEANIPPMIIHRIDTNDLKNLLYRYFLPMRSFSIQILQSRGYELWQRLIILGLFFQTVQSYCDNRTLGEIPGLIEKYEKMLEADVFKETLAGIPANTSVQRKILKQLVDTRLSTTIKDDRYMECLKEAFAGLNFFADASEEELENAYQTAYQENFKPFMDQYGYVMENYLVNCAFKNLFPMAGEKRTFDNYVMLILHYSLLKIHLIGTVRYHRDKLTMDHVLQVIQAFVKEIEHNTVYLRQVFSLIKANNMNTMAYMAILIKS